MPPGPTGMPMPTMGQPQAAPQSNLPSDVKKWRRDDYYQARREGDPRLKDAVKYLGKKFSLKSTNNAKTADQAGTLLVRLLKGNLPKPAAAEGAAAAGTSSASPGMPSSAMPSSPDMPSSAMPSPGMSPSSTPPPSMGPPSPSPDMGYSGYPGMPGSGMGEGQVKPLAPDTLKAIVEALAVNGGKVAKEALSGVLAGTVTSDSDSVATHAALECLLKYRTAESEATLLTAITAPDSIRPKPKTDAKQPATGSTQPAGAYMPPDPTMNPPAMGPQPGMTPTDSSSSYPGMPSPMYPGMGMPGGMQGKLSAADLQTLALAVASPTATEGFRVQVASALAGKKPAAEFRGALQRFLLAPNPENLAAQFVLLRSDAIDAAAKATIGSYLTTFSSQALVALLGIPIQSLKRYEGAAQAPGAAAGYPGPTSAMPYSGAAGASPPASPMPPPEASVMGPDPSSSSPYPGMAGYPGMGPSSGTGAPQGLSVLDLAKQYAKDPDLAYRVGGHLWGKEFVGLMTSQLDGVQSLASGAPQVVLATTIPTDEIRAKLYQSLEMRWREGPAALVAAGLAGAVVSDPGLLAIVKSLPRRDVDQDRLTPLQQRSRERRSGQGGAAGAGGDAGFGQPGQPGTDDAKSRKTKFGAKKAKGGQAPPADAAAPLPGPPMAGPPDGSQPMPGQPMPGQGLPGQQGGKSAEYLWMDVSELLVRAMCEQYAAAAKAAAQKGLTVDEDSRPIELPAKANVTAEYHLDWPKGLAQPNALSGVSPDAMTVHYVRLEQESSPVKIFAYFKRQIIRPVEHPATTGYWMESFRPLPRSDRKLSVDILVTRKEAAAKTQAGAQGAPAAGGYPAPAGMPSSSGPYGAGAPAGAQQPGQRDRSTDWAQKNEVSELVVEILTVEVKSPSPIAERPGADEGEEPEPEKAGASEKTPGKAKSKATTIE